MPKGDFQLERELRKRFIPVAERARITSLVTETLDVFRTTHGPIRHAVLQAKFAELRDSLLPYGAFCGVISGAFGVTPAAVYNSYLSGKRRTGTKAYQPLVITDAVICQHARNRGWLIVKDPEALTAVIKSLSKTTDRRATQALKEAHHMQQVSDLFAKAVQGSSPQTRLMILENGDGTVSHTFELPK